MRSARAVFALLLIALTACSGSTPTPAPTPPQTATVPAPAPSATAAPTMAPPPTASPTRAAAPTANAAQAADPPTISPPSTASPTATNTPAPPPVAPTPTTAPTAAPAPFKPTLTKLTDGGCCRNPVWYPDGTRVLYTDAIPNQQLAGTYAVPADGSGPPSVFWPSAATVSPDGSRIAFPDFAARVTRIQEFGKQSTATLANDAAYVWFSRDGRQVAWLARAPGAQPSSNVDRLVTVWVANADGASARIVRGGNVRAAELAWFPDGQRLLFAGRDRDGGNPGIYTLDVNTGALTRIVDAFSPRGVRLAPDGNTLVYLAALEEKPEDNGLFLTRVDGSGKRKLPVLGGVRWLPDSAALLVVPTQADNGPDQLVRVDAATLATTPLTDRAALPFRIAQDEWQAAPDGTRIAFTSLADGNISVLRFAP